MTQMLMSQFQDRLRVRARKERRPLSCIFEITPTCNLRCKFCYIALDPYKGPYLGTEQVKRVIDKVEAAGVLWLTLTGGEIFSRRDFPEIYLYAREKGLLVTLYTNATMITEKHAALLAEHPPFEVQVSIYGADVEHYEGTTGIPGSFARFERGIRLLQEAKAPLALKCPVSTITMNHVPTMIQWCRDRDLPFNFDPSIDQTYDGKETPTVYRIEPRQVKQLRDTVHEIKHGRPRVGPLKECSDVPPEGFGSNDLYTCGAGRVGFFIDALGQASHCVSDRDPSFPILTMEWDEIWSQIGAWVTQALPADAPCSGCGLRHSCNNCPARSRASTGQPHLKDTYHCDVTHVEHGLEPAIHPDYRVVAMQRPLSRCSA